MIKRVVASSGVGGYQNYRIPALATTLSGRLLAIYDGRPDVDDLPGPVDLVMRTSDDNGLTWSPQRVLRTGPGISGFGDASIVVDPGVGECGRVLVFVMATQLAGFFESVEGVAEDDPQVGHVEVSVSDDNGEHWTHRRITAQVKEPGVVGIFAASGMGTAVTAGPYAGRLLQPFVLRTEEGIVAGLATSDDHGITWTMRGRIPGGNESAVAALADGSVLVHSRATPYRLVARSTDGGATFTRIGPDRALPDPSDNGGLALLADGSVVCSHNHDSDLRRRTAVKRSTDGGRTWPAAVLLEAGSSAYSTVCGLRDGSVGVLYERSGYAEIVFGRVELSEFTPTDRVVPTEAASDGIEFTVAQRLLRRASPTFEPKHLVPLGVSQDWPHSVRREVARPGEQRQRLIPREQLVPALGAPDPGLRVGDELVFTGRVCNWGTRRLTDLTVQGNVAGLAAPGDLEPGERWLFEGASYAITEGNVLAGSCEVRFELIGRLGEVAVAHQWRQTFDLATGLPGTEISGRSS